MDAFLELDFTFVPTFTIYDANRDLMRARQADWHRRLHLEGDVGVLPAAARRPRRLLGAGGPRERGGVEAELPAVDAFINEYKNRGGRVCTGSDSGFIYPIFGFGYIRELELLQEAGFHPLEVMRAATSQGAALLRDRGRDRHGRGRQARRPAGARPQPVGRLQAALRHRRDAAERGDGNSVEWQRGLRLTIKDGVVYDTGELLADVREMVRESWAEDVPAPLPRAAGAAAVDGASGAGSISSS